jgi:protease-4
VWDGGTARQLGLVDRFGSLNDAVQEAARRAHLDPAHARAVYLEKEPGTLTRFFTNLAGDDDVDEGTRDAFARLAHRPEAMIAHALEDAQSLLNGPAIQARCLECPEIAPARPMRAQAPESLWARLLALVWRG